jgi:hypothetical protein
VSSDCACGGRGSYLLDGVEIPCGNCQRPPDVDPRPPVDRSTEIGLLVEELVNAWTDHDLNTHPGLTRLLRVAAAGATSSPGSSGRRGKVTGSPAPWNDAAALLDTTIAAGALDHEATLRSVLGFTRLDRSSTDHNADGALVNLPRLYSAAFARHPEHWLISGRPDPTTGRRKRGTLESDLTKWHRQAREVLGFDRRWMLVREVDGKPLPCTACGRPALHQLPRDGSVRCSGCGARWTFDELDWLSGTPYSTTEGSATA